MQIACKLDANTVYKLHQGEQNGKEGEENSGKGDARCACETFKTLLFVQNLIFDFFDMIFIDF